MSDNLELRTDGDWLTICLNRPEAGNALSEEMIAELLAVFERTAQDRSIRGITLRGNGGTFCAGGDLKGFKAAISKEAPSREELAAASARVGALLTRMDRVPQVLLVLVEGAAMAGGLGMLCTGDVVAVTKSARFALTEVTLGIPPAQIAPFLVQRLGVATARRLMLTAAVFDGSAAGAMGLADHVVDDAHGLEEIEARVRHSVRRCAPTAIAETKSLIRMVGQLDTATLRDRAAQSFAGCLMGEDAREGISAFLEKRKPNWALGS